MLGSLVAEFQSQPTLKVSWGFRVSCSFVLTLSPFNTSEVSSKNPLFQETSYLIRMLPSFILSQSQG